MLLLILIVRLRVCIYLRDRSHFTVFLISDTTWILVLGVALENDTEKSIVYCEPIKSKCEKLVRLRVSLLALRWMAN